MDTGILLCLSALVVILPIAHTTSIRAGLEILALLLWIIKMLCSRKVLVTRTPLDLPLLLFLLTILISLFTSLKLSASLNELRGEFLTYTLLFYLTASNIRSETSVKCLVQALLFGSMIMAVYGIIDFFANSGDIFSIRYRAGSLHQGYEAYAQYIIMVLPFNVLFIFYMRDRWTRIFFAALLVLNCFALFLTHTRGAWLAGYAELMLLAFFVLKRRFRWTVLALIVAAPLVMVKMLPEHTVWHGANGLAIEGVTSQRRFNTAVERLVVWKTFVDEFPKDPFTPAGYGKVNFKRRFAGKDMLGFEQAHNTFINVATQLGVQGLAALLVIIFFILKVCLMVRRSAATELTRSFGLAMFIMTIGFFTANQFAEFYIDDAAQMFWLLVGVAVALYKRNTKGA